MIDLLRTDSGNADFRELVVLLDRELKERDGEDHAYYDQFNKIDTIRHCVVAYQNKIAVGCGAIKAFATATAEVKRMYVKADLRGQGIAGLVLKELEAWAAELGYNSLVLETGKAQPEAIRLYQKSGYTTIPNYGQYAGIENSVCMQKQMPLTTASQESAAI